MTDSAKNNPPPAAWAVIAGLGNPGREYEETYHNAGQIFLNHLAEAVIPDQAKKSSELFREARWQNLKLVWPKTFMNESGDAIRRVLDYYGIPPGLLLVAHDDADLELGQYRLEFGRGAAGHHGVESIIARLGTKDFWRLRLGIRNTHEPRRQKAEDFVLNRISESDRTVFYLELQEACGLIRKVIAKETP